MNEQTIKGKWNEIKGEIQKTWGDITGDELESTKGNLKSIGGILQQKYGYKKDEVRSRLDSIAAKFGQKIDDWKEDASSSAAEKSEQVKRNLKNDSDYEQ